MHQTYQPKKDDKMVVTVNQSTFARGHEFMAMLRRGGKIIPRQSRRTEKEKFRKDCAE